MATSSVRILSRPTCARADGESIEKFTLPPNPGFFLPWPSFETINTFYGSSLFYVTRMKFRFVPNLSLLKLQAFEDHRGARASNNFHTVGMAEVAVRRHQRLMRLASLP